MRELKFRCASTENLMCFGKIDLFFDDYGNVVRIGGTNLDNIVGDFPSDNGVGKSSIPEILSVGLYGRSIKSPTKRKGRNLVSDTAKSDCVIEVQWDDYRVVRTIKLSGITKVELWKSVDHIWDDDSKIDQGKDAIQQEIERAIGLSHQAFCCVLVVDDCDSYAFLNADTPSKRKIVEELLGLDRYREYSETAKLLLKSAKDDVEKVAKEYERLKIELEYCDNRIAKAKQQEAAWKTGRENEIKSIETQIKDKQKSLEQTDTDSTLAEYNNAQEKIVELNLANEDLRKKREKLAELVINARPKLEAARIAKDDISAKIQERHIKIKSLESDVACAKKTVNELNSLQVGAKCPVCYGAIKGENYATVLLHSQNIIDGSSSTIFTENTQLQIDKTTFGEKTAAIEKVESAIREGEARITTVDKQITANQTTITQLSRIPKPEINAKQSILEAEIVQLKKQLQEKNNELNGDSPYKEILCDAKEEKDVKAVAIKGKEVEIKEAESNIPYYEFWVKSFGDTGIRKYIVDGIIPALNVKIAYWLHYLTNDTIELVFDNQLEETIKRNGVTTLYCGLSKSESRRVNLANALSFAYVMMLNSGCCPNLIFLDEVTGGGIDASGIGGVCNMVFELAKERRVFVTTHDERLLSMLQGCETLMLKKENDITVLLT